MSSRVVLTQDGSHTLWNEPLQQWYHSIHGAWQESQRVFIELGLEYLAAQQKAIRLLEVGFGTGFNALLTCLEAQKRQLEVYYTGIEAFPISSDEARQLNYDELLQTQLLASLHEARWGERVDMNGYFSLLKYKGRLQDFGSDEQYDLIYFDAFAPSAQPELWTVEVFRQLASMMPLGGVLTTYSSKGEVRRNLEAAGFAVEKHPGPGRKREVIRAILSSNTSKKVNP